MAGVIIGCMSFNDRQLLKITILWSFRLISARFVSERHSLILSPLPSPLAMRCRVRQTSLLLEQAITARLIGDRHQKGCFQICLPLSSSRWCYRHICISDEEAWAQRGWRRLSEETLWVWVCLTSNAIFLQGDCISSVLVWVNYFLVFLLILHRNTYLPFFRGLRCKHSVLLPSQGFASK